MPDAQYLRRELERLEGGSCGSYKRLRGEPPFGAATLFIDRVQSDSSRLRVRVPMDEAALPRELVATPTRRLALAAAPAPDRDRGGPESLAVVADALSGRLRGRRRWLAVSTGFPHSPGHAAEDCLHILNAPDRPPPHSSQLSRLRIACHD